MVDSIYREIIIDHYKHPHNFGKINNPTSKAEAINPLCGDKVTMYLVIKKEKISDIKFMGCGCAISIATASILTDKLAKMNINKIAKMSDDDVLSILELKLSPNRQKCALLGFWAVKEAIAKYVSVK